MRSFSETPSVLPLESVWIFLFITCSCMFAVKVTTISYQTLSRWKRVMDTSRQSGSRACRTFMTCSSTCSDVSVTPQLFRGFSIIVNLCLLTWQEIKVSLVIFGSAVFFSIRQEICASSPDRWTKATLLFHNCCHLRNFLLVHWRDDMRLEGFLTKKQEALHKNTNIYRLTSDRQHAENIHSWGGRQGWKRSTLRHDHGTSWTNAPPASNGFISGQ